MKCHALLVTVALMPIAACGKPAQQVAQQTNVQAAAANIQQGAEQVKQGAQQLAQATQDSSTQMALGLQQVARGFQQMAQASTTSVDFEQLKSLLPEVAGWTRSDARGEQMTMPVSYARAQARYEKDRAHIELEITDTALNQLLLAPVAMFVAAGYSERSDEGFKRATKIANQPGMEEWNVDSRRAEVTAVVGHRFIVHATGYDVDGIGPVRSLVEAVDTAKLPTLK